MAGTPGTPTFRSTLLAWLAGWASRKLAESVSKPAAAKSSIPILSQRRVERLALFTGRTLAALPDPDQALTPSHIACLAAKGRDMLEAIAGICVTDDLEHPEHATARRSISPEGVIRAWQKLVSIRNLTSPLMYRLYRLAHELRRVAAECSEPDEADQLRRLAFDFERHAIRLDSEYQWLEKSVCPDIGDILGAG